jgi:chaperonin cofactor prefoldin
MRAINRVLLMALLVVTALPAVAQQGTAREQETLRRLRAQAQQLQQSLTTAQQESQAKAQLAEAQRAVAEKRGAEADAARGLAARRARELTTLRAELDALKAEREGLQTRLTEAKTVSEQLAKAEAGLRTTLSTRDRELAELRARTEQQSAALSTCIDRNLALYGTGIELLDRYGQQGFWQSLAKQEPVLQLSRVKLENLIEGYRDRLDGLKLDAAAH